MKRYTLSLYSRKELAWLIAGVVAIGIFLGVALSCYVIIRAAEEDTGLIMRIFEGGAE